jgi:2-dehydropantoate 2-reductase
LAIVGTSIAVIGPGAIGASVAACLHEAGHAVLLCGRTPRDQLEVRPDDGEPIVVPGPVHTDPTTVTEPVDVVLLGTKTTQVERAAGWLAALCGDHTVVCALQNGVEQVEHVAPYCPSATVIPAVLWFPAEPQPDGWIRLRMTPSITLPAEPAAEKVAEILRGTRCRVEVTGDFVTKAWHKLMLNASGGLMALTGRRSGMFRRDDVATLTREYLAECLAVARAEGAQLGDDVVTEIVDQWRRLPPDVTSSILTDREAQRPLEWDIRNGVISRKAREHGLATPISDVVVPLLAATSDGPG